jgi:hypothetical protein
MEIKPEEVKEIKVIGRLNGDDVKVVQTTGGFNVAFGRKDANSKKSEALAGGSHIALVTHQVNKMYGNDFEPAILKSMQEQPHTLEDKTNYLPDMIKQAGIELFVISRFNNLEFIMCKDNIEIAKYETDYSDHNLNVKGYSFKNNLSPNKVVSSALAKAILEKMKELNLQQIVYED